MTVDTQAPVVDMHCNSLNLMTDHTYYRLYDDNSLKNWSFAFRPNESTYDNFCHSNSVKLQDLS